MEAHDLRKWAIKALDTGTVGDVGDIRNGTAGASATSLADIEAILVDLEDDGLAACDGGVWHSATHAAHLSGTGGDRGAQRRALVYIPSVNPSTFLHLSYWEGRGNYRLRSYESGQRVRPFTIPDVETVHELRRQHRFESEHEWPMQDGHDVEDVGFWAQEMAKLNEGLPTQ